MSADRPPTLDPTAAARWQAVPQLASPWLHEEVARRMADRLNWIVRSPRRWLHWEPLRGGLLAQTLVSQRYPQAQCSYLSALAPERLLASRAMHKPWWHPTGWRKRPQQLQEPAAQVADMLWANMVLHMAADPQALIQRWFDALAVDGFLMFSCLGPDTLRELRYLYKEMGWPPPSHEFTDMHDWGDMLVQAGFAEPVMDMERIVLTFETPQRLLQELRELGRNLHPARFAGLRGRGWLRQLHAALAASLATPASDGRLTLSFEIVYGHAFKPRPRAALAPQTTVSLEDMRAALKERKSSGA